MCHFMIHFIHKISEKKIANHFIHHFFCVNYLYALSICGLRAIGRVPHKLFIPDFVATSTLSWRNPPSPFHVRMKLSLRIFRIGPSMAHCQICFPKSMPALLRKSPLRLLQSSFLKPFESRQATLRPCGDIAPQALGPGAGRRWLNWFTMG